MARNLTDKQRLFIEHYIRTKNAVEACRQAGYNGSDLVLRGIGWENLTKPHIKAEVERRFAEETMSTKEALSRIASQARGADMRLVAQVLRQHTVSAALEKAEELGLSPFIKKIKENRFGFELEFYSAQNALLHILQGLGVFKEHIHFDTWQDEAIAEIKAGNIQFNALADALGDYNLAVELFRQAGVTVLSTQD